MIFEPVKSQQLITSHLEQVDDALLFVGMGIGKTAATLDHLNTLFRNCSAVSALIVAPMRVANLTWPMEVAEWDQFRWMRVANLRTESGQRAFLNGSAHLYTINYEALNLLAGLVERRGGSVPYDVVVFDELTRAKNPSSKRINLYRRKVRPVENKKFVRRFGLTGTPMPNSELDLFAQVRLIDDGARLGAHFKTFKDQLFNAPPVPMMRASTKEGTVSLIESKIADITLTLKSSEWLNIPDTVIEDVEIPFCTELKKRYSTLEKELVIELRKDKILNVTNAASLVTKLLQFTSGKMYDDEKDVHPIHGLKFEAIKKIAKKEPSPLLVAFQFKHEEKRLREMFPHCRFFSDCKQSNPEKTIKAEQELIKDWNNGKVRMLASHPASVGHGLNLQYGASAMLWISLTYSRESYEQMICRLARRGQKEITRVYRLMVPGTVDDAVAEALANKAENEARLIATLQMLESYRTNTP